MNANDFNIDQPLPSFPLYSPPPPQGIVQVDPRLQKALHKLVRQHKLPKRVNHKMTRKTHRKKIV